MARAIPLDLQQPLVAVNAKRCNAVARFIAAHHIPLDKEDSDLPGLERAQTANFYFALVAICHQTSPPDRPPLQGTVGGRQLRGWDYLFARFEDAARADAEILTPERWSDFSEESMRRLFRDPTLGDTLSDPSLRAVLLRDMGRRMLSMGLSTIDAIYDRCEGRITRGNPNLIGELSAFRAYSDPVFKKSLFFLALMRNAGLWRYVDPESLGTPVDYHEVRGHLRIGTVEVIDPSLRQKLATRSPVTAEEDVAIRRAVYDAIMLISTESGLRNPSQLHYLFWNVFRSVCTRKLPQCYALRPDCTLPSRYLHLADAPEGRRCPFADICASAGARDPVCEHVFETDYY